MLFFAFLLSIVATTTTATATAYQQTAPPKNILFIAIDDLRPQFGRSYHNKEVLTPNIDSFFLDNNGSSFQHAYVQIAVCGPSRASMLTGRRPDSTRTFRTPTDAGLLNKGAWCWCRRTSCGQNGRNLTDIFYTLPQYFQSQGYRTAGVGKIFHPDACNDMVIHPNMSKFNHVVGDDPRAWSDGYDVEANFSQMQWGSIPGPHDPVFNGKMGLSFEVSSLSDEEQTDGMLATDAIQKLRSLATATDATKASENDRASTPTSTKPFFLAVGFHKPHLPHIVPKKYYDMYPNVSKISLPPNPYVPKHFQEENWHSDGTFEIESYNLNAQPIFEKDDFSFNHPIDVHFTKQMRRAYFAATSFVDAQVGRVLNTLKELQLTEQTICIVWSDHGWHLGDTNSWGKMTTFESATRNTLLMRVPGQSISSQGWISDVLVESIDIFPTLIDLVDIPALPICAHRDDKPGERCLQGDSHAAFFQTNNANAKAGQQKKKKYAFSQWPTPAWPKNSTTLGFRMAYTVRSLAGYRVTEYVPYDPSQWIGDWDSSKATNDLELYDYNVDPFETTNCWNDSKYEKVLTELRSVLRAQFAALNTEKVVSSTVRPRS